MAPGKRGRSLGLTGNPRNPIGGGGQPRPRPGPPGAAILRLVRSCHCRGWDFPLQAAMAGEGVCPPPATSRGGGSIAPTRPFRAALGCVHSGGSNLKGTVRLQSIRGSMPGMALFWPTASVTPSGQSTALMLFEFGDVGNPDRPNPGGLWRFSRAGHCFFCNRALVFTHISFYCRATPPQTPPSAKGMASG